jgi:hypothetical protein
MASDGVPAVLALEVALSGRVEIRRLIWEMSLANRLWGAPRMHGELLKLGIEVAQATVAKYMASSGEDGRRPGRPIFRTMRQASARWTS